MGDPKVALQSLLCNAVRWSFKKKSIWLYAALMYVYVYVYACMYVCVYAYVCIMMCVSTRGGTPGASARL